MEYYKKIFDSKSDIGIYRKTNTIFSSPTDENEINNVIKSLKNSSSVGFDGINSNLVKQIGA